MRGGGPATRETDLLKPENMIEAVHAVVLSGGSAFGLAASTGVMEELAARGIGFPVESARVPIVVGACLFDLLVGQNAHPDAAMGRAAARAAFEREAAEPLAEGNVAPDAAHQWASSAASAPRKPGSESADCAWASSRRAPSWR
ncbi:MAG: P1 family peptidase [Eggerthellaceae bacterium]